LLLPSTEEEIEGQRGEGTGFREHSNRQTAALALGLHEPEPEPERQREGDKVDGNVGALSGDLCNPWRCPLGREWTFFHPAWLDLFWVCDETKGGRPQEASVLSLSFVQIS
jgi:hypothetical protein